MGREEQVEEREVLESIFPDEITPMAGLQRWKGFLHKSSCNKLSRACVQPCGRRISQLRHLQILADSITDISDVEFRLSIVLNVTNDDGDDSPAPNIVLKVKYPANYPDEGPVLDISAAANAPTYRFFDAASDREHLLTILTAAVEENLGMPMVYTLVSTLSDSAEQLIRERQAQSREKHEQRILAAEAEENKKFHGTPVTPETFATWRVDFRREMEALRNKEEAEEEAVEKKKNRGKETIERLTGKQLWQRGLAGKVEEEFEDGEVDDLPTAGLEKVQIAT